MDYEAADAELARFEGAAYDCGLDLYICDNVEDDGPILVQQPCENALQGWLKARNAEIRKATQP